MNVLFLAWNYPPAMGGIEYVAKHLVAGLRAAGDDVKVVARHAPGQTDETDAVRPARPGLLRYLWFAFWKSRRLLRDFRADLIVCPGVVTAPVAWMLARGGRPPFVVLAHGSDVAHGGNLYRRVLCYFFRAAAGVAANSRSTVELMHKAGCRPRQLRVIHPGVRLEDFPRLDDAGRQALRARHGLDGRFVLLSVGRLIRRKGVLDFIENALPRLVAERPNVLLVVVGGDAADSLVHREGLLAQIQSAVARTRLEGHVRLMGSVDDRAVRELHGAADVHLLPALRMDNDVEGFGIVLLEASLAEVPVVATRAGGIPEAVAEGVSGLLADPGDWDGLVHVLLTLARDDDLRKRLGQAGRARAQAEFGWGTIAGQYREFFRDLLAGRDAPA